VRCQPKLDLDAEGGEAGVGGWELGVIRVQAAAAAASKESAVCRTFARSLALGSYEFMHRAQHPRVSPGEFTGVLLFIGILRLNFQNCCVRASHHRTRTQGAFNSVGSAAMDTKPSARCYFLAFSETFQIFLILFVRAIGNVSISMRCTN